jgi:hypothetical protein
MFLKRLSNGELSRMFRSAVADHSDRPLQPNIPGPVPRLVAGTTTSHLDEDHMVTRHLYSFSRVG